MDIKSGKSDFTAGIASNQETFFHSIKVHVEILGHWYSFDCYAGFQDGLNHLGMGLLGRKGFFDLFESVTFDNVRNIVEFKMDSPISQP